MKYRTVVIFACAAIILALLVLALRQMDSAEAEVGPVADFVVYSNDEELTLENDPVPENQYHDVFYGDILELSEQAYDPDGSIIQETMAWSFQDGPVVIAKSVLIFTVGGNVSFPGRNDSVEGPVFGDQEPASPHLYWLSFKVDDDSNRSARKNVTFQVHPYARHTFSFNFSVEGENLSAEASLCWRGFEEEVVTDSRAWQEGKVYLGLKLTDAQLPWNRLPLNSWLDMNYELEVYGTKLQNGAPGFRSIQLKLPFTEDSVARLGVFEALREDVAVYPFDQELQRYGPTAEGDLKAWVVARDGNYLQGELVNGNPLFEEEEDLLRLHLGLAVKSIWTGEKKPDLVLVDLYLNRSHMLLENVVNITATVELRGVVFVNQKFVVRFLGNSGETLANVFFRITREDNRTLDVTYAYYIDEWLGGNGYWGPVDYVLSAKVDADLDIDETNESNNIYYRNETETGVILQVVPTLPGCGCMYMVDSSANTGSAPVFFSLACGAWLLIFVWFVTLLTRPSTGKLKDMKNLAVKDLVLLLPPRRSFAKWWKKQVNSLSSPEPSSSPDLPLPPLKLEPLQPPPGSPSDLEEEPGQEPAGTEDSSESTKSEKEFEQET